MLAGVDAQSDLKAKERNLLLFISAEPAEKGVIGKPMTLGGLIQPNSGEATSRKLPAQPDALNNF